MNEEPEGLVERIDNIDKAVKDFLEASANKKKPLRLWTKGLLGKSKLRRGYCIVVSINENGSCVFMKQPIVEGVIKVGDTFHAIAKDSIFTYKNKPLVFIAKNRVNPYNPLKEPGETHGDRYILARMLNEALKSKKSIGAIGWWIFILLVVGIIAYYFLK